MKIESENLEDHQVKLTVEIEADQFEASKRKAAKKIAKRIKIPGFRPGKAPYQVIQRHVGDEAILEESLGILVKDVYPQIIEQAEIEPYGPGNFENILNYDPLTLEFIVPLMSEVDLGEYSELRFDYDPPEITDQEVEAVEEDFRQRQAVEETAERSAQEGDHVYIRLSAKRFEEAEDEQAEEGNLIDERSTSVIIAAEGVETPSEWPFVGFSRELIGMSSGEDKTLVFTYPEDSDFESLQGVTADFSVEVEDVKSRMLPELNDEFAQSIGEYEDLESLEKDIRDSLEQRSMETYNSEYDDQIIDAIVESSTIKYPPQMLDNEINDVVYQLERRLANQGLDLDLYLKTRDLDEQGLRDEATPVAESRVKRSLILLEIAQKEEINVSEDELQQETERTMNSITNFMSESDRKQFDSPQAVMNLAGNIYAEMRMNRTLEYLRKVAQGELESEAESEEAEEAAESVTDAAEPVADEIQEADLSSEDESLDSEENEEKPEEEPAEEPEEKSSEDIDQEKQDSDEDPKEEQEESGG
ncbi:trigger factor [Chloroflexota bacterium]